MDIGRDRMDRILPRSVGDTSMITYISDKFPSYPVSCLFDIFFSDFLDAFLSSFDYIMTMNEFFLLAIFIICFKGIIILLSLIFPSDPL